jgi:hypothetical protein
MQNPTRQTYDIQTDEILVEPQPLIDVAALEMGHSPGWNRILTEVRGGSGPARRDGWRFSTAQA